MSCHFEFTSNEDFGWVWIEIGNKAFSGECSYIRDTLAELLEILLELKSGKNDEYLLVVYEPMSDILRFQANNGEVVAQLFSFGLDEVNWHVQHRSELSRYLLNKKPNNEFKFNLEEAIRGLRHCFLSTNQERYEKLWGHSFPSKLIERP